MVVDIPQLVIELNEPIRDCPPLFDWMLAKIEPSTTNRSSMRVAMVWRSCWSFSSR